MIIFLIMSFISASLELGTVFYGLNTQLPVYDIVLLPLFYQIGNFMMSIKVIPDRKKTYLSISAVSFILCAVNFVHFTYLSFAVQLVLCSFCLQKAREMCKKNSCPKMIKRLFRTMGFAASPCIMLLNGRFILVITFVATLISFCVFMGIEDSRKDTTVHSKKIRGTAFIMIFHQMHYFTYAYIMPIYFYHVLHSRIVNNLYCYTVLSILFAVTWIIYLIPESVLGKRENISYRKVFFIGHSFLTVCLGMMICGSTVSSPMLVAVFWIMAGAGGGTVFCIEHLSDRYSRIDMDFSENIGHMAGPLVAYIVCKAFADSELTSILVASCSFVILAILLEVITVIREGGRHNG